MPADDLNLTWPALLAHWTAFAQSSLALPKNAEGERWKRAVAPIIALQAVTFALGDIDKIATPTTTAPQEDDDRALAFDKAQIIVRTHTTELNELWWHQPMPAEISALIADASAALHIVASAGVEWRVIEDRLVADHPAELVALVHSTGFTGDLFVPTPGVPIFRNSPAAFARERGGSRPNERAIRAVKEFLIDVSRPERISGARQVYRQFDFAKGGPVRDMVAPLDGPGSPTNPPSGQPLLVPAILAGKPVAVTLPPRKTAQIPDLPVVFE